jgi:tetratricopeptide (TPR) repeat protein
VVVDVVGFSAPARTHVHHSVVRTALYTLLDQAFSSIGVPWDECYHEDRGDGVLVTVPSTVGKSAFVDLPAAVLKGLTEHNSRHPAEEQIRLRMALHAGEIQSDPHGLIGRALILAFRMLDSQVLRDATGVLGVIVSAWFYDEVVWHTQPSNYRKVTVEAKDIRTTAWIWAPDTPVVQPAAPHQLPTNYPRFVGRTSELAQLDRVLDGTVIITAIDGSAGIGKTTLALHWAHQAKDRFPDGHLHVNLRGFDPHDPVHPGEALHDFLEALGVPARSIPAALDAKAAMYRSRLADKRMLIILDNARSSDHVRPLLPGTSSCVTVITSRNRLDSLMVREGARRISLDVLSKKDALELLAERVEIVEPAAAEELVELCARLPLALSIVAARAAEQPLMSLGELAGEIREEHNRLDLLDSGDIDVSVRAVFSWSYNVLSPGAARLFRYLGVHPGPDIDAYACHALIGGSARAALRELTGAHMLTEYVPHRYRFHDLLRAYATELAEADPEWRQVARRMLDHYLSTAAQADKLVQSPTAVSDVPRLRTYQGAMAWFTTEHPVLMVMVAFAANHGFVRHTWQLADDCTIFLRRTGRSQDRATVHEHAVAATAGSEDRQLHGRTLLSLAYALNRLNRPAEARALLDEAGRYLFSAEEALVALVHRGYAKVYEEVGRFEEALAEAYRAKALPMAGATSAADVDNLVGRQLLQLGRVREAEPYCRNALLIYERFDLIEGQADALSNLGDISRANGYPESAIDHYQRSLDLDRRLGDRYWQAKALVRIALVHREMGDEEAAVPYLREGLAILRDINHPEAEDVALLLD